MALVGRGCASSSPLTISALGLAGHYFTPTVACALMAVSQTQPPKSSVLLRGSTRYVLGNDFPNPPMAGNTYLR